MKKIGSKFKTHVKNVNIVNYDVEKFILNMIFLSFGVLALLYIVFLGNMVKNIVERRSMETEARTLSSEVGDLELTYLSISNGIDLSMSYAMGFKETKSTFATRKSIGLNSSIGGIKTIKNDI